MRKKECQSVSDWLQFPFLPNSPESLGVGGRDGRGVGNEGVKLSVGREEIEGDGAGEVCILSISSPLSFFIFIWQ